MSFFDLISSRHSVRAFKEQKISSDIIEKILAAATRASSAGNLQSYQIFVISKKEDKKRLAAAAHGQNFIENSSTVFVFCADPNTSAGEKGLFNIFVSNGYSTPEAIGMMKEFLDCITIDFKGNGERDFVRKYIGIPDSQPVFDTVMHLQNLTNIHVEITDLVVPGVGDDLEHAKKLCKFVYDTCGSEMPIHFLQFHPSYKMMEFEPTPIKTLESHYDVAKKEGLKYVYVGNVPGHKYEHTYCSECNKIVIRRYNFEILKWDLDDNNRCKFCGNKIPIVGKLDKNYKERKFEFVL